MNGVIEKPDVYPSLQGRSVFVSGGRSGIGESLVEHFSGQGARVCCVDIAEDAPRAVVERIRKGDMRFRTSSSAMSAMSSPSAPIRLPSMMRLFPDINALVTIVLGLTVMLCIIAVRQLLPAQPERTD